jgi:serine/threonine protein kinase
MDPIAILSSCYTLYQSIQDRLDLVENNRNQFDLLKQKVAEIADPIDRLKVLHAKGQLPCTDKALEGLHRTLEKIQMFVQQKRFTRAPSTSATSVLNLVAELYHGADDKEQFILFDHLLSSSLQSLNLHITVKILDYTMAATKDAARAAQSTAEIQLTQIDYKKIDCNFNSASAKIGYGAFSTVCTGKYKKEYVAIKVIQQLGSMSPRDLKLITKEAMIMQFADHPNIMKLKGVSLAKGLLVMELALCSLADYLHRANDLARERCLTLRAAVPAPTLSWKLSIVRDVADAIRYLHSFSILHRDIKSANVLLFHDPSTGKSTAKVGDFGLALAVELVSRTAGTLRTTSPTVGSAAQAHAAGTPNYMAPELFDRKPGEAIAYSEASDVYSLGVLANEVLTEKVPWGTDAREMDVKEWVFRERLRPNLYAGDGASEGAAALVRVIGSSDAIGSCWNQYPSQRCTAEEVFQSAIFRAPFPAPQLPSPPQGQSVSAKEPDAHSSSGSSKSSRATPSPTPSTQTPPISPAGKSSKEDTSLSRVVPPSADAAQTAKLISDFADEIQVTFPDIFQQRVDHYAAALFKETIYDVARLLKQAKALKAGTKAACDKWFQSVGIHPFDAADILEEKAASSTANGARSIALIRADHGVAVLVAWLKTNAPDIALPHKRQHIAEALCANNITCIARLRRLAGRAGVVVPWLVSMQVDTLDAEDVSAKITALQSGGTVFLQPALPSAVQIPVPLALYDLDDFVALLAADLQRLLPDMNAAAARRYSDALFTNCIYTTARFLYQLSLKSNKATWLKSLGWGEFDVADMLDTVEYQGTVVDLRPAAAQYRSEQYGTPPLVQWLTVHLPSLKLPWKREQYAEALVANNVSTVHRLIVRGRSEAWLVGIGFDKLDAADCAAVLEPLAQQDVWVEAKSKKKSAEMKKAASEALQQKEQRARQAEESRRARQACCDAATAPCFKCCENSYSACKNCVTCNRYPTKYWYPDYDGRRDTTYKEERDYYKALRFCCCLVMSPAALDLCLCAATRTDCTRSRKVLLCPLLCMYGTFLCIGEQTCDNVGYGADVTVKRHCGCFFKK